MDRVLSLPGNIKVDSGRHQGEDGLPLAALLRPRPRATALEIWPCRGQPLLLDAKDLRRNPTSYVLVRSGRDSFKLIDLDTDNARPILKNIAAVHIKE